MHFFEKTSPYKQLLNFSLFTSFILRIVLLFHPITSTSFTWLEIGKIFITGLLSDFFVFIIGSGLLWLYLIFLSNEKYKKPWGYIILGFLVCLLFYVAFFNNILIVKFS